MPIVPKLQLGLKSLKLIMSVDQKSLAEFFMIDQKKNPIDSELSIYYIKLFYGCWLDSECHFSLPRHWTK